MLLAGATTGVGVVISLGEAFTTRRISEMDANIVPKLHVSLGGLGVIPRVLPSYALLFWFAMEVHNNICTVLWFIKSQDHQVIFLQIARTAALETFEIELFEYFQVQMAANILSLQGSRGSTTTVNLGLEPSTVQSLDELGIETVRCCKGLDLQEVCATSVRAYRQHVVYRCALILLLRFYIHSDMDTSADGR